MQENRLKPQELADALVEASETQSEEEQRIVVGLWRLLAEGDPVPAEALAEQAGLPKDAVAGAFERLGVQRDERGRAVALGLSIVEGPHRFAIDGRQLYTWCALDALLFPGIIGKTAEVTSTSPTTGRRISLLVGPEGVEDVEPIDAVVSIPRPRERIGAADVRGSFCCYVHFFASEEEGAQWVRKLDGGVFLLLPVPKAFEVGRIMSRRIYGAVLSE